MKIADQRGTPCRFDAGDVGEYFYLDGAEESGGLRRKIAIGKDQDGNPINTLIVGTGLLACTTAQTVIQPVEVELTVVSNTPER